MNLYSKPINDIRWADVEEFCAQQVSEGSTLDYKLEFPSDLERTVAAIANTLGGMILIGIGETKEGKPVMPIAGISAERGLAERVLSICADNITPPVIPSVEVCGDSVGSKAVVVIRIPQSHEAPHAIAGNTRIYIRTGKRNDPDELANLDRIVWLMNGRARSEKFRDWLVLRARERYKTTAAGRVPHIAATTEPSARGTEAIPSVTISLVPYYPSAEPLVLPQALDAIRRKISIPDRMGTAHEFPIQQDPVTKRLVEDGIIMHLSGARTYHTHLNMHGLYYFHQSLLYDLKTAENTTMVVVRLSEIIERVSAMIETGQKFYEELEYFGPLRIQLDLENILGWPLLISAGYDIEIRYSADSVVSVVETCSTQRLLLESDSLVHRLVRRIGWAFDYDISQQELVKLGARR